MNELKTMVAGNEAGFRVLFECATIGIPKARPVGLGLELNACKKNGIVFPVEISLGHYELEGESMAVAFITDTTERKKAETELIESKQRLNDEAVGLKFLSEAGGRLWLIENLREGLNEILASSMELVGVDKGNVQLWDPKKMMLSIVVHKGFDQEFLDYFREVKIEGDSACARALREEKQIIIADTEKEWFGDNAAIARKNGFRAVQSTPLFARDGSPIGIISTHFKNPGAPDELILRRMELYAAKAQSFIERTKNYEIIQRQNLELEEKVKERTKELTKSLEREKEMSELKSRFVSMASHEFRTPLSVILSSISLIGQYIGEGNERIDKHLSRVKASVSNLTGILNDFLSLDKLEQGKVEIEWEVVDVNEFLKDVIEEALVTQKKGQQISVNHSGKKWIKTDDKKLRYIIINLLTNAVKYSSEDTSIILRSSVDKDSLTFTVQDQGIGIPDEEQKHLFEKFFRAKNTGTAQGTGLGLTIVKRYVELMGGAITFVSKINEGTTFTIHLPQSS